MYCDPGSFCFLCHTLSPSGAFLNCLEFSHSPKLALYPLNLVRYSTAYLPFLSFFLLSVSIISTLYSGNLLKSARLRDLVGQLPNLAGEGWYFSKCAIFNTGWILSDSFPAAGENSKPIRWMTLWFSFILSYLCLFLFIWTLNLSIFPSDWHNLLWGLALVWHVALNASKSLACDVIACSRLHDLTWFHTITTRKVTCYVDVDTFRSSALQQDT